VDGRLLVQESPLYSRALLCNYTVSGVEGRWALFTHTRPKCGPLTPLSEVDVHQDDVVPVPAPSGTNTAVLVGIDSDPTVFDRLVQGTVVPLTTATVTLDGVTYRLVTHNAAEPFLVNAPTSVDGTNLQIRVHTISAGFSPTVIDHDMPVRLRFYEMRVKP
jgi:hypothetical protein